jgi:hypothetical protein
MVSSEFQLKLFWLLPWTDPHLPAFSGLNWFQYLEKSSRILPYVSMLPTNFSGKVIGPVETGVVAELLEPPAEVPPEDVPPVVVRPPVRPPVAPAELLVAVVLEPPELPAAALLLVALELPAAALLVLLPPVLVLPPTADDPAELETLLDDEAPPELCELLLLELVAPPEAVEVVLLEVVLPPPPVEVALPSDPSSEQPAPNAANVVVMMPRINFDRESMVWLLCPKPQADSWVACQPARMVSKRWWD